MDPKISKDLKKATEELQSKMLVMQQAEADMLTLKTAFVNATDPAKKEKLKPALIAMAKKLKAAEAEADQADAMFHKALSSEPEDIVDLLDHKIQEHIIRTTIRKIVKES
jgi:alkanesulfonate monooxygenase SsuD/methylene tetrahydromethanopterin reductase-like flavin-dependent oxidoreductase (luciferase family)